MSSIFAEGFHGIRRGPHRAVARLGRTAVQAFAAERDRWPLWLPVLFGMGVALYFALPSEPSGWLTGAVLAASAGFAIACRRQKVWLPVAVTLSTIAAGVAGGQLRTWTVGTTILPARTGPVDVVGTVVAVEIRETGGRIVLQDVGVERLDDAYLPARVRISVRSRDSLPAPGERVALRAALMPPPRPVAPGAYDFARQLYFDRIGAVGYAMGAVGTVSEARERPAWRSWLASLRHRVTLRILNGLDPPTAGFAAALLTGQRGQIPEDELEAMRAAGLAHLLAISGLHVGLVGGIIFFVVRAGLALSPTLALHYPIKKWAAVAALAGAFVYLLLTGGTIPTQRAFLMLFLVLFAVLVDRTAVSMRLVAWAAGLVLLLRPESLLGASFQLSFAAVVALVATYELWRARPRRLDPGRSLWTAPLVFIAGVAMTTVVASLATAPFAAFHFNRVPVYDLLANLAAVPIASLWVMPWGIATLVLMPVGGEALALTPMGWGIDAIRAVAKATAGLPGAVYSIPAMPLAALVLVVTGGLWLCLWRRRWRCWGVIPIAAGFLVAPMGEPPDILIEESGRLFAVRGEDGDLHLSSRRRARFSGENWLRRAGQREALAWSEDGGASGDIACDGLGCIWTEKGRTVAFVEDPRAFADDCRIADIVISSEPIRHPCPSARVVIDRFDLWREGAHAVWLDERAVRIETVDGVRGDRPWVVRPVPRRRLFEGQ